MKKLHGEFIEKNILKTLCRTYSFVFKNCLIAAIAVIVLSVVNSIMLPFSLMFLERLIDNFTSKIIDYNQIIIYVLVLFFLASSQWITNILNAHIKMKIGHSFAKYFVDCVQKIPFEIFENSAKLNLLNLAQKNPEQSVLSLFFNTQSLLRGAIQICSLCYLFGTAHFSLPLIYIFFIIIIILFDFKAIYMMNKMFEHQSEKERHAVEYEKHLYERPSLFFLKITQGLSFFIKKNNGAIDEILDERVTVTKKSQIFSIISSIALILWFSGTLAALIALFYLERITIGNFTALASALFLALSTTESFSVTLSQNAQNHFMVKKIYEIILVNTKPITEKVLKKSDEFIRFENVSFQYPNATKPIFTNLSFAILSKERTALVGVNGSGKSTILKLILRLYKPQKGNIFLFGNDINLYSQNQISKIFGIVFQDFAHFELSIRDNVALGLLDKRDDERMIEDALLRAGLTDFVKGQYDKSLGKLEKDSIEPSEGQWQKFSIARAMFGHKPFILFDEALASLDPVQEAKMYQNLNALLKDQGALMISHRMGTALLADRIMVLNSGKIIQDGKHEDLVKNDGLYKDFYLEQSDWYKEDTPR